MRTFQFHSPQPKLGEDVTRLWLAPDLARIGVVLGNGVENNMIAACWDVGTGRAMWTADVFDDSASLPAPDFDRELTRVVYHNPKTDDGLQESGLGLCSIASDTKTQLGTMHPYHGIFAPDGRYVLAVGTSEQPSRHELRRWPADAPIQMGKRARPEVIGPDPVWAIPLPAYRGGIEARIGAAPTVLAVSPDGRFAALGRYNGSVTVWDLATQRPVTEVPALKKLKHTSFSAHRLVFAPDGTRLAALRGKWLNQHSGFAVSVWTIPGGKQEKGPKEKGAKAKVSVNDAAFSPDGQTLLTAREDGVVSVWDVATWTVRREYAWKIGKLFSVAFSPDGLTCAAGGEKGRIVIWDVDT